MAELTRLEGKLGEVLGLAMASRVAAGKVKRMLAKSERDLGGTFDRMSEEAGETERRCTEVVSGFDGKKTAILAKAREVKKDATEMMSTYLEGEDEALDGFEFLTMAEAGEVGHWAIVKTLNRRAGNPAAPSSPNGRCRFRRTTSKRSSRARCNSRRDKIRARPSR